MSVQESGKEKEYVIVVNGERLLVSEEDVRFEEVVRLAFPSQRPSPDFTVTFRGARKPKEGSLKPDGSVRVQKEGAVFNVTPTTKS